jgi:hypothetical protein
MFIRAGQTTPRTANYLLKFFLLSTLRCAEFLITLLSPSNIGRKTNTEATLEICLFSALFQSPFKR